MSDNTIFTIFLAPLAVAIVAMIIEYWIIQPLREQSRDGDFSHSRSHQSYSWSKILFRFVLFFCALATCGACWSITSSFWDRDIRSASVFVPIRQDFTEVVESVTVEAHNTGVVSEGRSFVYGGDPTKVAEQPRLSLNSEKIGTLAATASADFSFATPKDEVVNLQLGYISGDCFNLSLYDGNGGQLLEADTLTTQEELTLRFVAEANQIYMIKVFNCDDQAGSYSLQINSEP